MSKIRKSARGEVCTFNIPGVCNHNPETTVLCHAPHPDKGMGKKGPDMNTSFYNTTSESNPVLVRMRQAALNQDVQVLSFFRQHQGEFYTPSEAWVRTGLEARAVPLTSVRRAISNLTSEGYLVRTTIRRIGQYGRREFTWVYPTDAQRAEAA